METDSQEQKDNDDIKRFNKEQLLETVKDEQSLLLRLQTFYNKVVQHQQINELLFKKLNDFNEQYELLSNRIRDNVDGNNETLTSYIGIYNHLGDELKILFPDINNQQLVNDLTTSLTSLFIHQISCLFYTLNQMSSSLFLPIVKYYHVKCATAGLNLKTSFNVNTFQIDEYDRFKIFVDKYEHVK